MRELKFRAWDKITKKYYAVGGLSFDENGKLCEVYLAGIPTTDLNEDVREPSDVILEQYTGIKDDKGKKIYDGDIIHKSPYFKKKGNKRFVAQKPYRNPLSVVEWDDDSGAFHEHEYEDGEFQIGGFLFEATGEWESLKGTDKNVIEVVGNIHENPELLGDTNVANKEKE